MLGLIMTVALAALSLGCGGAGKASFLWQPDVVQEQGSDVANRVALGIVDGSDGTLFYQALNGRESPLYSLYALDEATNEVQEVASGCSGMISAGEKAVFYRGDAGQGVFRYDRNTKAVDKVYDGGVENLLVTEKHLYVVNSDFELWELALVGGNRTKVADQVAAHYLEYADGVVYFAQMKPDDMHCNVCKITPGSPEAVTTICQGIPYPLKVVGTRVLYGDGHGVHLRDVNSGDDTIVYSRNIGAGLPAVNGNGLFYCITDAQGYSELWAYDLETGKATSLMPVHCTLVYFISGTIYLVNAVDLGFERVVLDPEDPHTDWVVESAVEGR